MANMFVIISCLVLMFVIWPSAAQLPNNSAVTEFTSSADSPPSCTTYITYRVRPPYSDIASISNLFGKSSVDIAAATNLTSHDTPLVPNQLLLIPVICTSNGTHYFSVVTYKINKDDTFYSIQVRSFQNLTEFHVVEEMNPNMNPNNLTIGAEAVIPLLCKCPGKSYTDKGIQFLTTYVWQPGDDLIAVSGVFQTSSSDIVMANNNRNFTAAVCLPVVVPEKAAVLVQLFPPPPSHAKSKHHLIVAASSSAFAFLIVFLCLAAFFSLSRKKKMLKLGRDRMTTCKESNNSRFEVKIIQDKLLPGVSGYLGKPIVYDINVIMKATMNLSERFRIGGSVYKATINNQILAVKKTRDATEEVHLLQRVNHANLVKLMGVSYTDDGNFCIAYEYVENGSLDKWLSPSTAAEVHHLSWSQRLVIALDVAHGLQYMHEHSQPSVVHKDIKTSNILLDSNFRAKIANLSAARPATSPIMLNIDVFSFGVVLLELLSGKKVMEAKDNGEVVMLWKEVKGILDVEEQRRERLMRWMDPNLGISYPIDDALSLATLARACTSENSLERPRMGEIVFNLCVLAQSSPQMSEKSCVSMFEAEEVSPVISPVEAR